MKTSQYCIPVELGSEALFFDSFSKAYAKISKKRANEIFYNGRFVEAALKGNEKDLLVENGFLVDESFNQRDAVIAARHMARLQKKDYHIIVNTTMDCNLGCWYCYETHKKGSVISDSILDSIYNHIKLKFEEDNLRSLTLGFFGGEPLLVIPEVNALIKNCSSFCNDKKIAFSVGFTTNGTIINSKLFDMLRDIDSHFQVTFDGNKAKHDSVRKFKKGSSGSFELICRNIRTILSSLPKARIGLRINYDADTLKNMGEVYDFIASLDPEKVSVSLHKVWQVDKEEIDEDLLFDCIVRIKKLGIHVNIQGYPINSGICYADCLNSCVINYDGLVYKCTARDFNATSKCGELTRSGLIKWDYNKLKEYCFTAIPQKCQECVLLPCCPGNCSQSLIENGGVGECVLYKNTTVDDIVLLRYYLTNYGK